MSKKKISGKTHSKQQLNHYAHQHNPNNKAYAANKANMERQNPKRRPDIGILDGESYGWCMD